MKLQLAGVSNCYPAVPQEQMQQRLEANPQMLAFHFRVLLRPRRSRHGAADDIYTIATARSQHRPLVC